MVFEAVGEGTGWGEGRGGRATGAVKSFKRIADTRTWDGDRKLSGMGREGAGVDWEKTSMFLGAWRVVSSARFGGQGEGPGGRDGMEDAGCNRQQ